ncbi:hypothetical protein Dimus_030994 [Dionaea muscipula]
MELSFAAAAIPLFLLFFLSSSSDSGSGSGTAISSLSLGINYGQVGDNLPSPERAVSLIKSLGLAKVRIYDTNPNVLTAFANSSVDLIVTVENDMLPSLAGDPPQALRWVTTHIHPYFPAANIVEIAVGNEVFTDDDASLSSYLVPAMVSIHRALVDLGLAPYMRVSSSCSLAVLEVSYPPSAGTFRSDLAAPGGVMSQFLHFLEATQTPFWINAYPYFAYKDDPTAVSLDYALSNPINPNDQAAGILVDPYTKLRYDNLLYAQVDAVIFAVSRMGYGGLEVRVSETGWPSKGDPEEVGATAYNAALYNRNLLRRLQLQAADDDDQDAGSGSGSGTPLRPNARLEVYLFALFNENLKPGPTSERNYGLFEPDCTMTYNVGLLSSAVLQSTPSSISSSSPSSASVFTSSANKVGR